MGTARVGFGKKKWLVLDCQRSKGRDPGAWEKAGTRTKTASLTPKSCLCPFL